MSTGCTVAAPSAATIAVASLFTLGALHWGGSARLVPFLLLFAVLVVVAAIDLEHCLIPNRVVFPALGLSVVATTLASIVDGTPATLGWAALGALDVLRRPPAPSTCSTRPGWASGT